MKEKKAKFRITKWIMLSFAILLNAFIIVNSSISSEASEMMTRPFTNFFVSIINSFTNKPVEIIPLENIDIKLSNEKGYQYNYLPGYKVEEIPLGSAKQIECSFAPENATDKGITYSVNPVDAVVLNQSGSKVSVVGMKTGDCVITAKSSDGGFESYVSVKVVETIAPTSYEISLENTSIVIGSTQTINFDIDGGVLTHDELINFRYYDIRKLSYSSLDESIATVDNYGVIYPKNEGNTTITVANGDYSKSLNISVTSGVSPTPYSNLSISGSNVCYANDMILDQSSKKNHYQLTPKDGEIELNPEDFIWSSSNELLVKVDKHGVMRGFRKSSAEDETAVITAKSKLTNQEVTYNVTVKNQLPSKMILWIQGDRSAEWYPEQYTMSTGEKCLVRYDYDVKTQTQGVTLEVSDKEVLSCTNEGSYITMVALKEGVSTIKLTSVINPNLSVSCVITVLKAGAISTNNFRDFEKTVRKSIGHATLFMVAQVFTYLTFFMFLHERKWWFYSSLSVGGGLFIAILSEVIQFFVPTRGGMITDVLIDFAGVVVGAALAFLGIYLVKKIIAKKKSKETETNSKQ